MPSTGVLVCDFCFFGVRFCYRSFFVWQNLLGDDDDEDVFEDFECFCPDLGSR